MFSAALRDARMIGQVRQLIARSGRVHVPGALDAGHAEALSAAMRALDWRVVAGGAGVTELDAADIAAIDPAARTAFLASVHANARDGFQFLFDSWRISDAVEAGTADDGPLVAVHRMMNSAAGLDLLRALTGDARIRYVDAQATRYRPGHFLAAHTDDAPGKHRLFAYVLNLTPAWRADWGGQLQFHAPDGHVAEAYVPCWNALNIFRVPQPHSVSFVAPFAGGERLSITGWLRAQAPAGL